MIRWKGHNYNMENVSAATSAYITEAVGANLSSIAPQYWIKINIRERLPQLIKYQRKRKILSFHSVALLTKEITYLGSLQVYGGSVVMTVSFCFRVSCFPFLDVLLWHLLHLAPVCLVLPLVLVCCAVNSRYWETNLPKACTLTGYHLF